MELRLQLLRGIQIHMDLEMPAIGCNYMKICVKLDSI